MLFDQFVQEAWRDHAQDVKAVAARLRGARELMTTPAHASPLSRLIVHVFGEHLGDWDSGERELQRLQQHPLCAHDALAQSALRMAQAALQCARGLPIAVANLTPPERIGALCAGSAVVLGREEPQQAAQLFEEAVKLVHSGVPDSNIYHRPMAVAANNLAGALCDLVGRSPAQNALMLRAAQVSRTYWDKAGTWLEAERAEYMLAKVNLAAGQFEQARPHAVACLSICQANQAPDFELFFAHEMLAKAAKARNDTQELQLELAHAVAAFTRLSPDDQAACKGDLDGLLAPV